MGLGSEDLDVFFDDFTDECTLPDGSIVNVIFDTSDQEALNGRVIAGDYVMMGKISELGSLKKGEVVVIKTKEYTVQAPTRPTDDDLLCNVYLGRKFT